MKAIPKPQTSPPAPAVLTSPRSLALSTHKPRAYSQEKLLEVDSPTCALRADGWKEEKAFGDPHALQAQARSPSHPKAGKAISTQTCTHPTQVRSPARRVTYVSSPCTVPNCRHTPAPVTHPKWTSAHPRGMQATQIGARVRLPFPPLTPNPGSFLVPFFCPTTITLATKELSRLTPASQFLLKPGWRPRHDKAGKPGSRQLSGVEERPNLSGHCSPECRLLLLFHLLGATLGGGDLRGLS